MAQLGGAARGGEEDVVAIGLGIGRQASVGGEVNENGEVGVGAAADLGGVDGNFFPKMPTVVEPSFPGGIDLHRRRLGYAKRY